MPNIIRRVNEVIIQEKQWCRLQTKESYGGLARYKNQLGRDDHIL